MRAYSGKRPSAAKVELLLIGLITQPLILFSLSVFPHFIFPLPVLPTSKSLLAFYVGSHNTPLSIATLSESRIICRVGPPSAWLRYRKAAESAKCAWQLTPDVYPDPAQATAWLLTFYHPHTSLSSACPCRKPQYQTYSSNGQYGDLWSAASSVPTSTYNASAFKPPLRTAPALEGLVITESCAAPSTNYNRPSTCHKATHSAFELFVSEPIYTRSQSSSLPSVRISSASHLRHVLPPLLST